MLKGAKMEVSTSKVVPAVINRTSSLYLRRLRQFFTRRLYHSQGFYPLSALFAEKAGKFFQRILLVLILVLILMLTLANTSRGTILILKLY